MKILIVDHPEEVENTITLFKKAVSSAVVHSSTSIRDAKILVKKYCFDVLITETKFEDGLGLDFAKSVKEKQPKINILIISNDDSYKPQALDIKVSGYLNKPLTESEVKKEMKELRYPIKKTGACLRIQCFGNFSVFTPDGDVVRFSRTKEKELLAYLIYKHGSAVSTKELGAVLFEDQYYDSKQQTYLQQLFHSLGKDLRAVAADEVIIRNYNSTSIDVSLVDCDYYRFSNNEAIAKRLYAGEFMAQYEWADYVSGYLDRKS